MTDARYPERWLNDRRILRLSDPAHRLFVLALAWSVSNRTDGALQLDDLRLIPGVDHTGTAELVEAGLWLTGPHGWQITDFAITQTTAAQLAGLEHKRAVDRDRQARHRQRRRADPQHVTRDTTRDVTRDEQREESRDGTRDTEDRPEPGQAGQEAGTNAATRDHLWAVGYDQ
ncbi:hypothetical protein GCM10009613_55070 [Pseudonocardia kongjuensis]|uniref:Uncharacterized protein n=1 Tax=Pseudonocardia kongjuensis TaxID=102227 RepID=A0ABN1Y6P6_9PSEU